MTTAPARELTMFGARPLFLAHCACMHTTHCEIHEACQLMLMTGRRFHAFKRDTGEQAVSLLFSMAGNEQREKSNNDAEDQKPDKIDENNAEPKAKTDENILNPLSLKKWLSVRAVSFYTKFRNLAHLIIAEMVSTKNFKAFRLKTLQ